jgi:hypothetical protein
MLSWISTVRRELVGLLGTLRALFRDTRTYGLVLVPDMLAFMTGCDP